VKLAWDVEAKPGGSRHFFEAAGSADKSLKLYEGGYHDPLADLNRETVIADILAWLNARAAKSPAAHAEPRPQAI
jgi:acylglycerol lipase